MCVELAFGNENIPVKNSFDAKGRVLVRDEELKLGATPVLDEIYWDGWIREEDKVKWTSGQWCPAEILATKFNQRGRWYDVPPGQIIKGIAFNTGERIILKVVTREAVGKEAKVQDRFAATGRRILVPRS